MSELADLVRPLQRAVAPPGRFRELYSSATSGDMEGYLADAFAEAKLYGFFSDLTLNVELATVTPDLSTEGQALVVLFAANRVLENTLSNTPTHTRYEAPGVVAERDFGSQMLSERLKDIRTRKEYVLAMLHEASRGVVDTVVVDAYAVRALTDYGRGFALPIGEVLALGNV